MTGQSTAGRGPGANPAESYQRYFVPAIGAPMAEDLVAIADLRPGERVLDIACGTGVAARMAFGRVGADGSVTGLDIHPGMLAVARSATPPDIAIDWREGNAEALPFADDAFDVVLCQMGLQFVPGKIAALREMRRVLEPGGRAVINLPGPKPPLFAAMTDALARHFGPPAAGFVDLVFSLHDPDELGELVREAGFADMRAEAKPKTLRLPPPADFLWQYVRSTPLAGMAAHAGDAECQAFERDVCAQWREFAEDDGSMSLRVGVTTGIATK